MSDAQFTAELEALRERCGAALARLSGHGASEFSPRAGPLLARLFEASAYGLSGGKRIRPLLVYAAAEAVDPAARDIDALDYLACAAEMIHAYSLAHDDLPSMDDDAMRRGRPACHIAFDEATAILAGDGLQARAYELLTIAPGLSAGQRLKLVRILSAAAGQRGMVGGQAIDIAAADGGLDSSALDLPAIEAMHALKTGALIRACIAMGAAAAGADDKQQAALDDYGAALGTLFQICDDILDAKGDSAALGRPAGADAARGKASYAARAGLEHAGQRARALLEESLKALEPFGDSAWLLRGIARRIAERAGISV